MKKFYTFLFKTLLCLSFFLMIAIISKKDVNYKNYIYKKLYQEHFDFSSVKMFYNKYLGGILPLENISNSNITSVFNEKLIYQGVSDYEEGAILNVNYNYIVPAISKGLIVYIGEKEKYGKVVIVEGDNGIDIWYGNLCNVMVNLYDVISEGNYLGEVCDNKLYLIYTKKNEFLDYKEYLN